MKKSEAPPVKNPGVFPLAAEIQENGIFQLHPLGVGEAFAQMVQLYSIITNPNFENTPSVTCSIMEAM